MTKPIGPLCNLDCEYCFYLEKEVLYPEKSNFRMSDDLLEHYIRSYVEAQPGPEVNFAWQGGEPTLLGVGFFRKVVAWQKKYGEGRRISNAFQTNGTLLNDEWGEFLHESGFLVGVSIDGPARLHDRYRVDKGGGPTFSQVARGVGFLKKHKVEFNTLTVVNRANSRHPLEVYRFLKKIGSGFIQFIPLVERSVEPGSDSGLGLAAPPDPEKKNPHALVTSWSVRAEVYGEFLVRIFDEWVRKDVGKTFVQIFDVTLGNWTGMGGGLCLFSEKCGLGLAMEHNGDLYSCDHYVYPEFKLGNILDQTLGSMVDSGFQKKFGNDKSDTLPEYCRNCEVRFACHGECPKHRFLRTPDGEPGLNFLCAAYKRFFRHVGPAMNAMGELLRAGRPPAAIMDMIAEKEGAKS